jgi:hypothetical protein
MSRNHLSGSVPAQLLWSASQSVDISNNELSGTIPTQSSAAPRSGPVNLNASNNSFTGPFPLANVLSILSVQPESMIDLSDNCLNVTSSDVAAVTAACSSGTCQCYISQRAASSACYFSPSSSRSVSPSYSISLSASASVSASSSVSASASVSALPSPEHSVQPSMFHSHSVTPTQKFVTGTASITSSPLFVRSATSTLSPSAGSSPSPASSPQSPSTSPSPPPLVPGPVQRLALSSAGLNQRLLVTCDPPVTADSAATVAVHSESAPFINYTVWVCCLNCTTGSCASTANTQVVYNMHRVPVYVSVGQQFNPGGLPVQLIVSVSAAVTPGGFGPAVSLTAVTQVVLPALMPELCQCMHVCMRACVHACGWDPFHGGLWLPLETAYYCQCQCCTAACLCPPYAIVDLAHRCVCVPFLFHLTFYRAFLRYRQPHKTSRVLPAMRL